ncbi:hypothetical protein ACFFK7_10025 [Pseudoalteromonas xiamenensis]|uniref:hypothetical protein n=1 Tax=Pseudoalteromonas xiamenensis TaxID=882626 RepID=UPI0035EF974B
MSQYYLMGSAIKAPTFYNERGVPNWSGMSETRFTSELKAELQRFIEIEGFQRGYEDECNDTVGLRIEFFHPEFMSGAAQITWEKHYHQGVAHAQLARCKAVVGG